MIKLKKVLKTVVSREFEIFKQNHPVDEVREDDSLPYVIYLIEGINSKGKKSFYIGLTSEYEKRKDHHFSSRSWRGKKEKNKRLYRSMSLAVKEGRFETYNIRILQENLSLGEAIRLEIACIAVFRKYLPVWNTSDGGEGTFIKDRQFWIDAHKGKRNELIPAYCMNFKTGEFIEFDSQKRASIYIGCAYSAMHRNRIGITYRIKDWVVGTSYDDMIARYNKLPVHYRKSEVYVIDAFTREVHKYHRIEDFLDKGHKRDKVIRCINDKKLYQKRFYITYDPNEDLIFKELIRLTKDGETFLFTGLPEVKDFLIRNNETVTRQAVDFAFKRLGKVKKYKIDSVLYSDLSEEDKQLPIISNIVTVL